jgi:hypothetical protein
MLNTSFVRGSAVLISMAASLGQSPAERLQRPDAPDRHVIAGRVIDSRGLPPRGVVVRVNAPKPEGSSAQFLSPVGENGEFETQPSWQPW